MKAGSAGHGPGGRAQRFPGEHEGAPRLLLTLHLGDSTELLRHPQVSEQ